MPKARITGCFTLGLLLMLFYGTSAGPFNPDSCRGSSSPTPLRRKRINLRWTYRRLFEDWPDRSLLYCGNLMEVRWARRTKRWWRIYTGWKAGIYSKGIIRHSCCLLRQRIVISEAIGLPAGRRKSISPGAMPVYSKGRNMPSLLIKKATGFSLRQGTRLACKGPQRPWWCSKDGAIRFGADLLYSTRDISWKQGYESTLGMDIWTLASFTRICMNWIKPPLLAWASHQWEIQDGPGCPGPYEHRPRESWKGLAGYRAVGTPDCLQIYSSWMKGSTLRMFTTISEPSFQKRRTWQRLQVFYDARTYKQLDNSYSLASV